LKLTVRLDSAAAQAQLRRWGGELRQKTRQAARRALMAERQALQQEVRGHVAAHLKVARKAFLRAFSAKVLDRDPRQLPALLVASRVPWAGIHEAGGTIAGRLLIPLHGRVGRKTFRRQLSQLIAGGNAYFIRNAKGHLVLMAENIAEHDRPLAGFKRRYRQAAGIAWLKRGDDVPLAVLVPRVSIPKRLDVQRLVEGALPRLKAALERQLQSL
jgi:hypothetical protein